MKRVTIGLVLLTTVIGAGVPQAQSLGAVRKEVESLRAPEVPWRQIPWKSCLIEGLSESKKTHKPVILWIFIDRPVDDARC